MAAVTGQDSNLSSIRYAIEQSQGVLPGSPVWKLTEPNTLPKFGPTLATVTRKFITEDRMSRKGSVTDRKPGAEIPQDFTLENQLDFIEAVMCGALRTKGAALTLTTASGGNTFNGTGMAGFAANNLVLVKGWPSNNGLHLVTSATAATVVVGSVLINEAAPAGATLQKVGHQFASADVTVNAAGARPILTTAAGNFTTALGLIAGESIYIGGDAVANQYADAANNGGKRVYATVGTNQIVIDKSELDMITDASATGKSIRIFLAIVSKNEQGAAFLRRFLQLEQTLGAPDDAQPTQIQSHYIPGCVAREYTLNVPSAEKITSSVAFSGKSYETRTGVTGLKSGTRPDIPQVDAVNTSSDIKRWRIARVSGSTDEAPVPLFALVEDFSMTINNNIDEGNALGVVGTARHTWGGFDCTGDFGGYFADVDSMNAANNYDDCTIDGFVACANNSGFAIDFPLVSITTEGPATEADQPIMQPCEFTAHSGNKYDVTFDHAVLWSFFPYLPSLARTVP